MSKTKTTRLPSTEARKITPAKKVSREPEAITVGHILGSQIESIITEACLVCKLYGAKGAHIALGRLMRKADFCPEDEIKDASYAVVGRLMRSGYEPRLIIKACEWLYDQKDLGKSKGYAYGELRKTTTRVSKDLLRLEVVIIKILLGEIVPESYSVAKAKAKA